MSNTAVGSDAADDPCGLRVQNTRSYAVLLQTGKFTQTLSACWAVCQPLALNCANMTPQWQRFATLQSHWDLLQCHVANLFGRLQLIWSEKTQIFIMDHGTRVEPLIWAKLLQGAKLGERSSVRADWLCIGCPRLVGSRKEILGPKLFPAMGCVKLGN